MSETRTGTSPWHRLRTLQAQDLLLPLIYAVAVASILAAATLLANAILLWLCLTLSTLLSVLCAQSVVRLGAILLGRRSGKSPIFLKLSVSVASLMLTLTLFEIFLQVQARSITYDPNHPPEHVWLPPLTLPVAWEVRSANAKEDVAVYWHGHLHFYDRNGMRLTQMVPRKPAGVFRIVVVGDSMTYGFGVPAHETYPAVMQQLLREEFAVEVHNLGVAGLQSEDIRSVVTTVTKTQHERSHLPPFEPDLIVYGVCLNDYLPKGGLTRERILIPFPLPARFKQFMTQRTRVGQFFSERYADVMMRCGLQEDFMSQIQEDFETRKTRFVADAKAINDMALQRRIPAVMAMVLTQDPDGDPKVRELAHLTESLLREAGLNVIPSDSYLGKFHGRRLVVSRWEGHPNSAAHRIFAEEFVKRIRQMPEIEAFRHRSRS